MIRGAGSGSDSTEKIKPHELLTPCQIENNDYLVNTYHVAGPCFEYFGDPLQFALGQRPVWRLTLFTAIDMIM